MSEHTKGPWTMCTFENEDRNPLYEFSKEGTYGGYIGHINTSLGSLYEEEHLANAHLIAAAPDLLEVCEFAIETLREWVELGRAKSELNALDGTPIILTEADCCQLFEEIEQILFQVGRAHAKAKGETEGERRA